MRTHSLIVRTIIWLVSGIPALTSAQVSSPILENYIQTGLSHNLTLQQQQIDWQRSLEAVRQAKSLFYPVAQFNATYTRAAGGRRIDFPIGDLLNPVYSTLNQLTQSNQFPALANQQIQFLPDNFHETYVGISYPLFNADLKFNRQIQEHLAAGQAARKETYEQELRFQITTAYLQYLQALQAETIWQNTRKVLQELVGFNESLVRNNVATNEVVAAAQYERSRAEQEIAQLQAAQKTARAYFNFLLNRNLQDSVLVDSSLLQPALKTYDLETLVADSGKNRQELSTLEAGQAAAATALRLQEANRVLPDLYLGGQIGFQGFGYRFSEEQAYVLVQAGLRYDLFTGGQNKQKIQMARLENDKLQVQEEEVRRQIALQVMQAWHALEAGKTAWQSAVTGRQAAEEAFRIIQNKYKAGQALLLEYLDAQNRATGAQLQTNLAWIQILQQEATLRRAAGL
jgi:outer membrane protein TolC